MTVACHGAGPHVEHVTRANNSLTPQPRQVDPPLDAATNTPLNPTLADYIESAVTRITELWTYFKPDEPMPEGRLQIHAGAKPSKPLLGGGMPAARVDRPASRTIYAVTIVPKSVVGHI